MQRSKWSLQNVLLEVGFIIVILTGIALYGNREAIPGIFKEAVDIYEVDANEISAGMAAKAEVYAVLDVFGTMTETTSKNGSATSSRTYYYYIIPVFDGDEPLYISVKTNSSDHYTYEEIADNTWDWLYDNRDDLGSTTIYTEGIIKKLDSEGYEYMLDWFEESEYLGITDRDEIEKYVLPLVLEPCDLEQTRTAAVYQAGGFAAGILLLVLGFLRARTARKKEKQIEEQLRHAHEVMTGSQTDIETYKVDQINRVDNTTKLNENHRSYQGSYDAYFEINGMKYMKSDFEIVDDYVNKGDIEAAIMAIRDRTGFDRESAAAVADNWKEYYI